MTSGRASVGDEAALARRGAPDAGFLALRAVVLRDLVEVFLGVALVARRRLGVTVFFLAGIAIDLTAAGVLRVGDCGPVAACVKPAERTSAPK
jgi:hypothetical protein